MGTAHATPTPLLCRRMYRALWTSWTEVGGWRSAGTEDEMIPENYLTIKMNSFPMLAGRRTLTRTFIGIHVDFITPRGGISATDHAVLFSTHLYRKTHFSKKGLSTASRWRNVHCTNWLQNLFLTVFETTLKIASLTELCFIQIATCFGRHQTRYTVIKKRKKCNV